MRGADTPEIQTKSKREKKRALLARDFDRERIGKTIYLENVKLGNFAGRVVATVTLPDGSNLAKILIREGPPDEWAICPLLAHCCMLLACRSSCISRLLQLC